MKYVIILGDGMADYPLEKLGNKTPLEIARKPNIDFLCRNGEIGLVKTVPDGHKPGSDTANLSVMGYDPNVCYTGRSPLEAVSMGINLAATDIAVRCNIVTLSSDNAGEKYEDKKMIDYSSSEITTAEARELVYFLQERLGTENYKFYGGISYRHCFVMSNTTASTKLTPPHDITDKPIKDFLPSGLNGKLFLELQKKSFELLNNHPINVKRRAQGLNPANSIWLWGEGTKPKIDNFESIYGKKCAVISAVDLIKGIGLAGNMQIYEVEGATGTVNTNFDGKAKMAIKALDDGNDIVYLHIEAADECGHHGDVENKITSIERIDNVAGYIFNELVKRGEEFSIMVLPDHPTPICLKTHVSDPVPFLIYRSNGNVKSGVSYSEQNAKNSGNYVDKGFTMMRKLING